MEPTESKVVMIIGHVDGGWCVLNAENLFIMAGPYQDYSDAIGAAQSMAFRVAQGWNL